MKVLNYTGLQNLWTNIKNYITVHTPTKTSDLTNDSNFVDTSNAAVSSGITSAKVTDYDTHIADTDKHVTTADKTKWNNGVSQAYVVRYASVAVSDNSTVPYTDLNNTDNIKANDLLLDTNGKLYQISSVDTSTETVSVTTPLTQLAQDSDVVHKSGNETIGGIKTFTSDLLIYNPDTTAYASYLNLKNQKNARGSSETGSQWLQYQDKNNKTLTMLESRVVSNRNTVFNIVCYNIDDNNQPVSDGVSVIKTSTATNFAPTTDNAVTCGRALARWSDVQTYKVNNLEPSSLSLPSDRSARIDISSYFIYSGNNATNNYSVLANGYIFLKLDNINQITCYSTDSSSITNYAQTYTRPSDGVLYITFPVRKNDNFRTIWNTGSSVSIENAYFIPSQGNV